MALVLVLVVLALIAGIVFQVQATSRALLRKGRSGLLAQRLRQAAFEAVHWRLELLAADDDRLADSLNEPWAETVEVSSPAGVYTRLRTIDENRFFDLNNLSLSIPSISVRPPAEMAQDLFTLCGDYSPLERVGALIDWMDDNDEGPAEAAYYAKLDPPYRPGDHALLSWDELLHVRGFSASTFERHPRKSGGELFRHDLIDCVTVIPVSRTRPIPVNVNTASAPVLLAILGPEHHELAEALIGWREQGPVRHLDPMLAILDPARRESIRPFLGTVSRYFRIEARSYADGHALEFTALAMREEDGAMRILRWTEGGGRGL